MKTTIQAFIVSMSLYGIVILIYKLFGFETALLMVLINIAMRLKEFN